MLLTLYYYGIFYYFGSLIPKEQLYYDKIKHSFVEEVSMEVSVVELERLKNWNEEISESFKTNGFKSTEIDEGGFVPGKLNLDLKNFKMNRFICAV